MLKPSRTVRRACPIWKPKLRPHEKLTWRIYGEQRSHDLVHLFRRRPRQEPPRMQLTNSLRLLREIKWNLLPVILPLAGTQTRLQPQLLLPTLPAATQRQVHVLC